MTALSLLIPVAMLCLAHKLANDHARTELRRPPVPAPSHVRKIARDA